MYSTVPNVSSGLHLVRQEALAVCLSVHAWVHSMPIQHVYWINWMIHM